MAAKNHARKSGKRFPLGAGYQEDSFFWLNFRHAIMGIEKFGRQLAKPEILGNINIICQGLTADDHCFVKFARKIENFLNSLDMA